ncbi:MAG: cytidine deaminase [Bacteroidota bacterium]
MKKIKTILTIQEFSNARELDPDFASLLHAAKRAAKDAYAPYSEFQVGCAVWLDNNVIVQGNNQENIAFPSGMCAERVALFSAKANFPKAKIKAIAITAESHGKPASVPIYPCGSCRQVIAEYESLQKKPITILLSGTNDKIIVAPSSETFLPFQFNASLKKTTKKK